MAWVRLRRTERRTRRRVVAVVAASLLLVVLAAGAGVVVPWRATGGGAGDGGNLVRNGSFARAGAWMFSVRGGAAATFARERVAVLPEAASVRVTRPAPAAPWNVQLGQTGIPLRPGQTMTLSFVARATGNANVGVVLQRAVPPYTVYLARVFAPGATWQRLSLAYTPYSGDASALLAFNLGQAAGQLWLGDVRLVAGATVVAPGDASGGGGAGGADNVPLVNSSRLTRSGWRLIWNDEFDGPSLDTAKWQVESDAPGGDRICCLGDGLQYWDPGAVGVRDGQLVLTTARRPMGGRAYTSGAVNTLGTFSFEYGRLDIRARLPRGDGLWTAFWLLPAMGTALNYSPYEIDMMETLGQDTRAIYFFVHWQMTQRQMCAITGPDFAAGYHVYSLVWTPTALDWYVDGVRQCEVTQGVPQQPMYLILNLAVDQTNGGPAQVPATMRVDYVRVWQH